MSTVGGVALHHPRAKLLSTGLTSPLLTPARDKLLFFLSNAESAPHEIVGLLIRDIYCD